MIPHSSWRFEWEIPDKKSYGNHGIDDDFFGDFSKKNGVF